MITASDHSSNHRPFQAATLPTRVATLLRLWRKRRRDRAELAWWCERDLHEVGTSRAALEYEFAKPFWRQ